jgi:NAD(P)-dependent dehydrogenase (short-subunit alcohol dehydrogenase family)
MKIEGSTFIITGGTGGIGGGAARMLLSLGARVALFDVLPEDKGAAIAAEMGDALYVRVDITDDGAVKAAVRRVVDSLGNLRGCVHCAGVAIKREWTNDAADSIPDFRKMLDINVAGTFIVNAHVADAINYPLNHPNGPDEHAPFWTTDEERGVIINFASAAAAPYARVLGYGPGKLAVVGITKAMADFLGPSGIRVVSISPCKSGRGEGKRRIRGPDRWGNEPNRATR